MNFIKWHLGDYSKDTAHLSWMEDCAYRRLLDAYYRREKPIRFSERYRLVRAVSKIQRAAVDRVLAEFFTRNKGLWRNKRCEEEIAAYQKICEHNKAAGLLGGRPKKTDRVISGNHLGSFRVSKKNPNQNQNQIPEPGVLSNNGARADASTRITEKNGARALLEKHHVNFDGTWLGVWEAHGVERIEKAIAIAKDRLKGQELRASYLDAVLTDEKNFAGGNAAISGIPWFLSAIGIENKAQELGIEPGRDEAFPEFKVRVYRAAGVTADDIRKAEAEHR